jgi:hypothetical protein
MPLMSVDLEVWSVNPLNSVETLSTKVAWRRAGSGWACAGLHWQIGIEDSAPVDSENAPRQIASGRKVRYLTRLTLEPSSAPESAHVVFRRIADELAHQIDGVVHDPQADMLSRPRLAESVDIIEMNWWFLGGPLTTRGGALSLLRCVDAVGPEFRPKRYGEWEPPRHRFEPDRVDHFLDLLFASHPVPSFVWRTAKHTYVHYYPTCGPGWQCDLDSGTSCTRCPALRSAVQVRCC